MNESRLSLVPPAVVGVEAARGAHPAGATVASTVAGNQNGAPVQANAMLIPGDNSRQHPAAAGYDTDGEEDQPVAGSNANTTDDTTHSKDLTDTSYSR